MKEMLIFAIMFKPFDFPAPKDLSFVWFTIPLALCVPDEG
jgi:hypothetical protein